MWWRLSTASNIFAYGISNWNRKWWHGLRMSEPVAAVVMVVVVYMHMLHSHTSTCACDFEEVERPFAPNIVETRSPAFDVMTLGRNENLCNPCQSGFGFSTSPIQPRAQPHLNRKCYIFAISHIHFSFFLLSSSTAASSSSFFRLWCVREEDYQFLLPHKHRVKWKINDIYLLSVYIWVDWKWWFIGSNFHIFAAMRPRL